MTTVDVRLPPGTRADATGQLVSGRGLRDTTDVIAKDLDKRGILYKQVGPYRVRGAELTRFISQTPATSWLAVHVLRTGGKTFVYFVARPAPSSSSDRVAVPARANALILFVAPRAT